MHASNGVARPGARGWLRWAVMALMCLNLWACGGGGEPSAAEPPAQAASTDATLALAESDAHQSILEAVPRAKAAAASDALGAIEAQLAGADAGERAARAALENLTRVGAFNAAASAADWAGETAECTVGCGHGEKGPAAPAT